jgi:hypothetical protein
MRQRQRQRRKRLLICSLFGRFPLLWSVLSGCYSTQTKPQRLHSTAKSWIVRAW